MNEPVRLPDRPARDVIEHDLAHNVLVEAGAGSGKTESLARRMAAGIAAGEYEIEGMAAVTFTRKAAAELRGRFQLELERRLAAERDGARNARVAVALERLERLFAGTIHAFCAHLLRERPVEAGVAPGFTEQDEVEDVQFRRRAWRDYLDRERARGSAALTELEGCGIRATDLDSAFDRVCTFSDVAFPPGDGKMPDIAAARAALDHFWAALQAELPPHDADTTCKLQIAAEEFRRRRRVGNPSRPAVLAELLECWLPRKAVTQKWWPGTTQQRRATRDRVEALVDAFRTATVEPFVAAWRHHCYRLAATLLAEGREFARDARRRAVALNYGDLLELAARLLREDVVVRDDLQAKYRWLFVDEFQDTNPLQAEVMLLLAAQAGAERDWRRVALRPGALFVVGDPKQSIYRFTGADIETYERVRTVIERSGGRVVELTASFRSVPALCAWANDVFARPSFFPDVARPEQPVYHALHPVRAARAATALETLVIPESVQGRAAVVAFEAEAIARYIRDEVDRGRRRWGDFLVLTQFKKYLPVYAAALDALRIPSVVSGTATFAASCTVAALADLLRALADPDDGITLVGVLRGPLFGVSDELLFRHRQRGWGFMLTAPLPDEESGAVAAALRALRVMYRHTRALPVPAALGRIVESTGLLAQAAALTPGGAEAGDLLHAIDRVRRITEDGGTLAEAAEALEQDLESSEVESVPLEPGRDDVVRVMNLHKVKGLEAAVVFLADPLGDRAPSADVHVTRDGPQALGYLQMTRPKGEHGVDVLAEPAGWAEHAAAELRFLEAERKRLLYVAATRARDVLVVGHHAGSAKGSWQSFAAHLTVARPLAVPASVTVELRRPSDIRAAAREAAAARRDAALESARQPSWTVESVTGTAHHAGPPGHPLAPDRTREPDTGMAWGTLVHALLENAMRGPHRDRRHLERLANWLTVDKPALRRVVPEALDTVERVMASELWRRAQAATECLAEVPFAVKSDGDSSPRVLYGVIDLAFSTAGGWHIVDYKTDQAGLAALTERYAEQVRAYVGPWARLVNERIVYAGLFAVRADSLSDNLVPPPG
jgi:ATP-dependent helicase/nuclease subunit A